MKQPWPEAPTQKTGRHRVMFLSAAGGAAEPQGCFRNRAEAKRWAGKRKCWVVWEPVFPGEELRWTVRKIARDHCTICLEHYDNCACDVAKAAR